MRRIKLNYTSTAADQNGFAAAATGASWALTATEVGDDLEHQVTITGLQATDHSAKTVTVTGTGANGEAVSESINLPNGTATVTTSAYYLTVATPLVPSATIGADSVDIGWGDKSRTPWKPCDDGLLALGCKITGTPIYSVKSTFDGSTANQDTTINGAATDSYFGYTYLVQAVRVEFTAAGGVLLTGMVSKDERV